MALNIKKELNGKTLQIALEGRLDTTTAPNLSAEIADLGAVDEIVWDFNKLNYISSAGLRVLFKAQKDMSKKGGMKILGANDDIKEIFDITGSSKIFTVL